MNRKLLAGAASVLALLGLFGCARGIDPAGVDSPTASWTVTSPMASSAPASATASPVTTSAAAPTSSSAPAVDQSTAGDPPSSSVGYPTSPDVTVVISWTDSTGQTISVGASVPGLVEADGQCIATATQGDISRTASGPARPDAQSTICQSLTIEDISAGEWTVRVQYTSAARSLESEPTKVVI
ncbi:MAG: hypothetical protein LBV06_10255 [Propionibacteriaceae bacterium]|nr:hypothetical protein [Propionibacteriaceae bacterium]